MKHNKSFATGLLFRFMGFVMIFAFCLVFWAACIAAFTLGFSYGLGGLLLAGGCALASYCCFSEWLEGGIDDY